MRQLGLLIVLSVTLVACSRPYIAPILPGPHRERIEADYDAVWAALVKALAQENVPVKAIARDSGVLASDAFPTTIGLYADCGRYGDRPVEGQAQVTFTIFLQPVGPSATTVQVNTQMRAENYRQGSGKVRPGPPIPCASTGRWEANLLDTVRQFLPR